MTTYLIEAYFAGDSIADLRIRALRVAQAMSSDGHHVQYLSSILIPADETSFHLVEAGSEETIVELARRLELGYERIVRADDGVRR